MMESWHSYPKVYALGHKALEGLLDGHVIVQEKVDGSQLSFGKDYDDKLWIRSRGRVFDIDAPDSLFSTAAAQVKAVADKLTPGWTYRGEYLAKPKHNALAYQRTPLNNIILFDISIGKEQYANRNMIDAEAFRLGFEAVPILWEGDAKSLSPMVIDQLMNEPSALGGMIEGIVVKNYSKFTFDGHAMFGKYVSEKFKEVHKSDWAKENPAPSDVLADLATRYRTEARWLKAVQHLREAGKINQDPSDIGALFVEVKEDFNNECKEDVKEQLWLWAKKRGLMDKITRGLPEWYKQQLLEGQFTQDGNNDQ